MMAVVVAVSLYLIFRVVVHNKYNIILIYSIMFKLGKYDLSISITDAEPIQINDIIDSDYFNNNNRNKKIYRNVLDINGVRKKVLGKKLLKNMLKNNNEFSTKQDATDILDLLNLFHR